MRQWCFEDPRRCRCPLHRRQHGRFDGRHAFRQAGEGQCGRISAYVICLGPGAWLDPMSLPANTAFLPKPYQHEALISAIGFHDAVAQARGDQSGLAIDGGGRGARALVAASVSSICLLRLFVGLCRFARQFGSGIAQMAQIFTIRHALHFPRLRGRACAHGPHSGPSWRSPRFFDHRKTGRGGRMF